ncbi:MAG: GDP-mannose 4,6-dehydratase [Anaerolineales bacterium]|nr:GDP-mannose 4,6-dehydratase [Anaerolineales bacterium]
MNFRDTYQDKKILITGGLGFVGSNLAHTLLEIGAQVTTLDIADPESGANPFNLDGIKSQVRVIEADIRDGQMLREAVEGQDIIFNLAGEMSHIGSMTDPFKDLNVNTVGHLTLLEMCRLHNPDVHIVFAGTRQVYGRATYLPVDEKHLLTPLDNNGVSKRAGEMYHIVYHHVHGIITSVLRMTNTYGARMRIRDARLTFIGWWVRQLLEGKPIQVYGDGKQVRDMNHVDDVIDAFLRCACHPKAQGQIYNLGGEPITLLDLAKLMVEEFGSGSYELVPFPENRRRIDIGDYYGDYNLIRSELGWQPRISHRQGIRRMLDYYLQNSEHYF